MVHPVGKLRRLARHRDREACFLAAPRTGVKMTIQIAVTAVNTSNSINVNGLGAFMMGLVFFCINRLSLLARIGSTPAFFKAV
jgi:hypothetical protein